MAGCVAARSLAMSGSPPPRHAPRPRDRGFLTRCLSSVHVTSRCALCCQQEAVSAGDGEKTKKPQADKSDEWKKMAVECRKRTTIGCPCNRMSIGGADRCNAITNTDRTVIKIVKANSIKVWSWAGRERRAWVQAQAGGPIPLRSMLRYGKTDRCGDTAVVDLVRKENLGRRPPFSRGYRTSCSVLLGCSACARVRHVHPTHGKSAPLTPALPSQVPRSSPT